MNEEKWQDAKAEILRKYYKELYQEEPHETRQNEYRNGNVSKGLVLKKIDLCIEIFERSLLSSTPTKRNRVVLELEELTTSEKFFLENLLIKFMLQGRLAPKWIRDIDLTKSLSDLLDEA